MNGGHGGLLPVETEPEQQARGDRSGKGNKHEQEATANPFRPLLDRTDLRRIGLGLLQTIVPGGVVLCVHILP